VSSGKDFIGPYRLVRLINTGASCQIYEAAWQAENRRVALKVLLKRYRQDKSHLAELQLEYNIGKDLKHPNVVETLDFSDDRRAPYLAMELLTPRNLKQVLRDAPQEIAEQAEQIIRQAAAGLAYFHSQGWIHCDVKPDNFVFSEAGDLKLIDFSIAQKVRRGLGKLLSGRSKNLQGTRSYMSPEQIRGESVDVRSDIYSFGCMLYELIGGRLPFTGASSSDLLNKHLKGAATPLTALNDNISREFAKLIARTMSKEKEQRPESMEEFLEQFEAGRIYVVKPQGSAEPPPATQG